MSTVIVEKQGMLGEARVFRRFSVSVEFTFDLHSAVSFLRRIGEASFTKFSCS